jgi:hypothetical protein
LNKLGFDITQFLSGSSIFPADHDMQAHELLAMMKADVIALANEQGEFLRDAGKNSVFCNVVI